MAKTDNLSDFLTDVANSIRTKTGTTDPINAQDFSAKILNISSEPPANMVTTDTEQTITGKKTIGPSNSLAFKNNDNTGEYRISTTGNDDLEINYLAQDTSTPKQIFKINSGGTMFTSLSTIAPSTAGALNLGYGSIYPLGTVSAQYLSDGNTTKSMTEVLNGQSGPSDYHIYSHYIRIDNVDGANLCAIINIISTSDMSYSFYPLLDFIRTIPEGSRALPVVLVDFTEDKVVVGGSIRIHPNYPDDLEVTGYDYSTNQTIKADINVGTPIFDNIVVM